MQELPDNEKATHKAVKYERPSEHGHEHCGNCKSVIEELDGVRCKTVQSPIWLNGWCERWPGKA
jgi:hypothetical protein